MHKLGFAMAAVVAALVSVPAGAVGFINTQGGDGTFTAGPAPFFATIASNNDDINNNITQYTEIVPFRALYTFFWEYTTFDVDGSSFDPAGYLVGAVYTQLTANGQPQFSVQSGSFAVELFAGEEFGFYVNGTDGVLGRGQISFGLESTKPIVPEPATWAMMIAGFGLVGAAMRRRKVALAA
jgi:hypothetical protein